MPAPTLRVVVVGAGAIGAFVGARVAEGAGGTAEVTLVGRTSLRAAVEREGGAVRSRTLGAAHADETRLSGSFRVADGPAAAAEADVVIIAVKSGQTREACEQLLGALGTNRPTVVSLQNGVRNPRCIREVLGARVALVVAGVVEFNVVWNEHACFEQSTSGQIMLGSRGPAASSLARMMRSGGLQVLQSDDITAQQYGKLLVNLNNGVNGLVGVPVLSMLRDGDKRRVVAEAIAEARDVFRSAGIRVEALKPIWLMLFLLRLPDWLFSCVQPLFIKIDAAAKTSLLQDLEAKRLSEVDLLNGEVLAVAREHGLPEPRVNAAIVRLVKLAEARHEGSPCLTGAQLLRECGLH
jgi:2-dehydropantoate 2-reductase